MKQLSISFQLPQSVTIALETLERAGFEAYLVGGAVRNFFLGKDVVDFDITTNALPGEMKIIFKSYPIFETGIHHGTITVLIDELPLEITTFRIDHPSLNYRHPQSVVFTSSLEEDCRRRDFTMNALCYSNGLVYDFFGGIDDLQNKIIRFIGNPEKRIEEDALRILRAIRFSAQFQFDIEKESRKALFNAKDLLSHLSKERITSEFEKILCSKDPFPYLIDYASIWLTLFPELIFDFPFSLSSNSFTVQLALLLYPLSEEKRNSLLNRLSLSNQQKKEIHFYLQHTTTPCTTSVEIKQLLLNGAPYFQSLLTFKKTLQPTLDIPSILASYHAILESQECISLKQLAINGSDILALGIYPPQSLSIILNHCLNLVILNQLENKKEVLLNYVKKEF